MKAKVITLCGSIYYYGNAYINHTHAYNAYEPFSSKNLSYSILPYFRLCNYKMICMDFPKRKSLTNKHVYPVS